MPTAKTNPSFTGERPDDEEYQAIISELREAKTQFYKLQILKSYESKVPGDKYRSHETLLSYLSRGKPIGSLELTTDIRAQSDRVSVLQSLLDDWNERESLWQEQNEAPAADPVVDAA